MAWLRRLAFLGCALLAWAVALSVLGPGPQVARANAACDIGVAPADAVTGAFGIGSPVGDACNTVTDPVLDAVPDPLGPIKGVAESIGQSVFDQITSWAADGAVWLLGRVVALTNKTTSPNLLSKGFLRQYREMAAIATVLALAMLLLAVLEAVGRGELGMLVRVFLVNVPLAAIATSAACVVVQLLIAATDGFSEVVTRATADDTRAFFKSAVAGLSTSGASAGRAAIGAGAGEASGAVGAPLFVAFIAAILAAFAAFFIWIELLMRDAAIYVTALFMPLAIAASIWPRWISALRRTAELLLVVVFSKFVIVAIIALAASLLANAGSKVEHVLAAGALLLLACFAPFVLFRLVPFAEGAVGSAFNRQSAGGATVRAVESPPMQMMRRAARANWSGSQPRGGSSAGGGGSSVTVPAPGGSGGGASAGKAAGAGGAVGAAALPVAAGAAAVGGTRAAAGKLAKSGTAQASSAAGGGARSVSRDATGPETAAASGGGERALRPRADGNVAGNRPQASPSPAGRAPEPAEAKGGGGPAQAEGPPRPPGDTGTAKRGSAGTKKS